MPYSNKPKIAKKRVGIQTSQQKMKTKNCIQVTSKTKEWNPQIIRHLLSNPSPTNFQRRICIQVKVEVRTTQQSAQSKFSQTMNENQS